ncbi:hypothetical protein NE857_09315 [Nocardiopsis exhalans]|uniref:Uncharacterized protein n=1 Tax=Nocardiopsis exhalans TaxID=163604 RepID=A0ABY5DCV0_9ACTN|nr:hypothetical protein [Nocardiopsis exhalans]USY21780.1 hypothetical protein NE857_09315 [Nocardiopsis exhalans]
MAIEIGTHITYVGDSASHYGNTGGVLKLCECELCVLHHREADEANVEPAPRYVCLGTLNEWSMWVLHHVPAEHLRPHS